MDNLDTGTIAEGLWNDLIDEENYGINFRDHVLEQYKLYVEKADEVSTRRGHANTLFLSIQTFLITVLGLAYERLPLNVQSGTVIVTVAAGLALCIAWWMIVRSYRQLNSGKFKVIAEFERRLPASPFWRAEWKMLGEGKDIRKYLPLSYVENIVPVIFAGIYIVLGILILSGF